MMGVVEVNIVPILTLNLWEHCYWEEHNGESSSSYFETFWSVLDWQKLSENFEKFNTIGKVAPII